MSLYSLQNYDKSLKQQNILPFSLKKNYEKVYVPPIVMLFSNEKEGEHLKDARPQMCMRKGIRTSVDRQFHPHRFDQ